MNKKKIKLHEPIFKDDDELLNTQKVEEPSLNYIKNDIQSFNSFEDMENEQLKYFASLTPTQLLINLKQLVIRSFGIKDESVFKNMPRVMNLNPPRS
jgi:hypothetical protein